MKKYVLFVLIILMTALCGGCGGNDQYVIDKPVVYGLVSPDHDSDVFEKLYQDELVEVIATEEKNGEKWFKIKSGAYILAEECSKDEDRVKQAKKVKEEMDQYIGKRCLVADSHDRWYPINYLLASPGNKAVYNTLVNCDSDLVEVNSWKMIEGEVWFSCKLISSLSENTTGWIAKKDCIFDEKQVEQFQKRIDEAIKERQEYEKQCREEIEANPLVQESWTKTEDMLSFVYVEVTNNTDKEQQAIVEVKFYQDGVYLGKLMNLDTVEPHGKWRTKFLANTFVTGNYTYKVELKEDIFD